MSLGQLLLGVFLVLLAVTWLGWVAISLQFLGIWALVTGIVWLVEGVHPLTVYRRP